MAERMQAFRDYRPTKTALFWSCAATAIVVVVLGFTWGGWVTGGTASEMADERAAEARAQLAASVCVERFMNAGGARAELAEFKAIDSSWDRDGFIEDGGWATIGDETYDEGAELCAERLMERELPAQEANAPDIGASVQ